MYSPIYVAEQKMLFPHRMNATTPEEVAAGFNQLITAGITTLEEINNTNFGSLMLHYFPRCSSWCVVEGLHIYKSGLSKDLNRSMLEALKKAYAFIYRGANLSTMAERHELEQQLDKIIKAAEQK